MSINLKSIKKESINSVFNAIAGGKDISRADISRKTDLSLMTVGKVTDMLLENNIIIQAKETKHEVGRRAGLVNLNTDKKMAIFDLSSYNFKLNIFDAYVNFENQIEHKYDNSRDFETNLTNFLNKSKEYIKNNISDDDFVGMAISVPGPYYELKDSILNKRIPQLNSVRLKKLFSQIFGFEPLVIEENVKLGAMAHIRKTEKYRSKIIFYLHIGEGVSGAISIDGRLVRGMDGFSGQLGQMIFGGLPENMNIEDYIKSDAVPKAEKLKLLETVVHDIIWLIGPHTVIIESEDEMYDITTQTIIDTFKFKQREFPEIISTVSDISNSYVGAALLLRERWLESILI